jgi:hypothetical protein
MVVDAAITNAHEHYGWYCRALGFKDGVMGSRSKYDAVELEFQEEAQEMEIVESIRDVDVIEVPEEGKEIIVQEESAMSATEIRRASEIEQNVREQTGLKPRALSRHPDGLKQDGDDGKDHIFWKAYTRIRKTKPAPGGVTYTSKRPLTGGCY